MQYNDDLGVQGLLEEYETVHNQTGLPIIHGEFSYTAMDSGVPNLRGARSCPTPPHCIPNHPFVLQRDRAAQARMQVATISKVPYVIGYHWWRWVDETPGGRWPRGENSNYGLVRINNEAYAELTAAFTEANRAAPAAHASILTADKTTVDAAVDATEAARPLLKSDDSGSAAGAASSIDTGVTIQLARPVAAVGRDFVGHAWDYSPEGNQSVLKADLSSPRLINLVKNLAGVTGSVLRIGGGAGDCAVYQVGPKPYPVVECGVNEWAAGGKQYNAPCTSSCPGSNISGVSWCLTPERWDALHAFANNTGLKILYGLNGFHGQGGKHALGGWRPERPWDPTNVDALLAYSAEKKFVEQGTLLGFEMGNEITENEVGNGSYWGQRFVQLAGLVRKHWPEPTGRPGLFGPDQTRSGNYGCKSCFPNWTKAFLDRAAPVLAGVTFHAYPGHSQDATPAHLDHCDILNPSLLQKTLNIATKWQALVQRYRPRGSSPSSSLPLILGEASACSGGGAEGISDRYAISFWFADTLGAMAQLGVRGMNRQAILSNNYSLIDIDRHGIVHQSHVHPDYYIAWFWGKLMGTQVLGVDNPNINTTGLRVYAHCAASHASGEGGPTPAGAVSVVAININGNVSVSLHTGLKGSYRIYSLTGADERGVQADSLDVNGKAFAVQPGPAATMPPLRGAAGVDGAPFTAPVHSISFLVFESAAAEACSLKLDDADVDTTTKMGLDDADGDTTTKMPATDSGALPAFQLRTELPVAPKAGGARVPTAVAAAVPPAAAAAAVTAPTSSLCHLSFYTCLHGGFNPSLGFYNCYDWGFIPSLQAGWLTTGFTNDTVLVRAGGAVGIASMLYIGDTFFEFGKGLRSDYARRWQAQAADVEQLIKSGHIVGFFVGDEIVSAKGIRAAIGKTVLARRGAGDCAAFPPTAH